MQVGIGLKAVASALALALSMGQLVGCTTYSLTTQSETQVPTGLSVARAQASGVDAVRWDGDAWVSLVPSSAIPTETFGPDVYLPRITSIVPNDAFTLVGLNVLYCSPTIVEGDSCYDKGVLYNTALDTATELTHNESSLAPVAWMPDGQLLVENYLAGYGLIYDTVSLASTPLGIGHSDYSLPRLPQGLSASGSQLLYSSEDGERIYNLSSGTSISLPHPQSAYNTAEMVFDPTESLAAVVQIPEGRGASLGGQISIFSTTGTSAPNSPDATDIHIDFSPAWANGGQKLVFLRANRTDLQRDPEAYGADLQTLPAAVVEYDLASGVTTTLVPDGQIRRALVVPGNNNIAAYLEDSAGVLKVFGLSLPSGTPTLLLTDEAEHTALGWAQ